MATIGNYFIKNLWIYFTELNAVFGVN